MKCVLLAGSESEASIVLQHVRADQSLAGVKVLFWKLSGEASDVSSLDASVERVAASGAIEGVAASSLLVYVCAATSRERRAVVSRVKERFADAAFPSLVHRTAVVAPSAKIGQGAVIGALAVVDADAVLHNFVRVGASAVVEAGAVVGDYVTVGAASVVGARAVLDADITLDANASIRSGVKVASNTHLASQSSLEENVVVPGRDGVSWSGVPAKLAVAAATISSNPASRVRWCYRKPFSSSRFLQYLGPSIAAGHVTNDGPLQLVTASKLKSLVRTTLEVQLCANGTAALHALVSAFNIRDKKEYRWATQAFTFPCSIQGPLIDSIVLDHDAELLGPSMAQLEARKEEFDGVIVTNVFGLQTDVLAYERWCRKNKKLIVFDNAATPVGFAADGRCIHDIGDGSIISLHETKPFGRGEGGVVLMTKDLYKFVHQAMNFGFDIAIQVRIPNRRASNWRMSDIAAAAVCDHFDYLVAQDWLERYQNLLRKAEALMAEHGIKFAIPLRYPTVVSCLFISVPPAQSGNAEALCKTLNALGYEAKHYYYPLGPREECPLAWKLYDSTICLPFHLQMEEQLPAMLAAVKKLFSEDK